MDIKQIKENHYYACDPAHAGSRDNLTLLATMFACSGNCDFHVHDMNQEGKIIELIHGINTIAEFRETTNYLQEKYGLTMTVAVL